MNITNEKVTDYINSLYRPLKEKLALLRAEGEKRHVPVILRDSETMLVSMIEMNRPDTILEIGTAIGYSAAVFSVACTRAGLDTKIITVEIDPLYAADAEKNLAGLRNVRLIRGDACKVMNEWGSDRQIILPRSAPQLPPPACPACQGSH